MNSTSASTTTTTSPATPQAEGPQTSQAASGNPGCRSGDPLANVYHPYRFHVRNACMTVTGTVAYVRNEDDGDVHMALSLTSSESSLLNQANYAAEHGQLVAEIVPADEPGCTLGRPPPLPPTAYQSSSYDYGICTGAQLSAPPVGTQVSVTGPYVLDSDHSWMEIHPVWAITVLASSGSD